MALTKEKRGVSEKEDEGGREKRERECEHSFHPYIISEITTTLPQITVV